MAKQTGGLLAFGASGSVAKTIVYSTWRGRQYVRRHVIPANPQTTGQMATRDVFAWLSQVWKVAPTLFQNPWTAYAQGQPLTNRNAFNKFNVGALRSQADLSMMIGSPGAKGGLAATALTVTAGSGQLTLAITAPTAPAGWTLVEAVGAVIRDQDPASGTFYDISAGSDSSAPYSVVLTGLTASQLYRAFAWLVWTKPDGSTAYGPAINGSGTPT